MSKLKQSVLLQLLEHRPWLTRKDVALLAGCTVRSVDRLRRRGELPKPFTIHGPRWTLAQISELTVRR